MESPASERRYELVAALLDEAQEPLFALDGSGVVLECNRAAAQAVGRARDGVLGAWLGELVPLHNGTLPRALGKLRRAPGTEQPLHLANGALMRLRVLSGDSGALAATLTTPTPAESGTENFVRGGTTIRVVGTLRIDLAGHRVEVDGTPARLTPSEFRLLALLAGSPGEALSRREIMQHLWESSYVGDEHACDVHVSNIRRKIERNPARPERLVTVRGVGYRLVPV
jgi:hypothetical protein